MTKYIHKYRQNVTTKKEEKKKKSSFLFHRRKSHKGLERHEGE